MNTQSLIDSIHSALNTEDRKVTKALIDEVLTTALDAISDALKAGEEVSLRNFGRFYTYVRPARAGRNPRTGEAIQISDRTIVKFVPRGELGETVQG